ncbi:hypothetical protein PV05_04483 [Exophiala xenobiotica]|uniref:Uncharacterized protein n=1 Tax=Exophiala xenobiotica TaxID=348802 RepID=A0A0D2F6Y4_9EURO|nr:uncharacterized protein PV05_04483 [Exophiala xenobiotica]KIW55754.1 hypothetical protein PV05_04483 [Exophiala xenobiotica]
MSASRPIPPAVYPQNPFDSIASNLSKISASIRMPDLTPPLTPLAERSANIMPHVHAQHRNPILDSNEDDDTDWKFVEFRGQAKLREKA